MDPAKLIKSMTKSRMVIAALVLAAAVTAVLMIFFNARSVGGDESRGGPDEGGATVAESDIKNMSREEIEEGQLAAARAALTGRPVSGRVTERPDYVSRVEWEVFHNVIKKQPGNDDAQLTVLVNKLLFYKKREAWESSGANSAQRAQLGRELRDMLPYMIQGEHIHPDEARELESALAREQGR